MVSRFLRLQARAAGDGTCNGLGLSFGIGISGLGRIGGTLRQRSRPDSRASNAANAPGKYGPAMQPDTPFVGHQFNLERYAFKFFEPPRGKHQRIDEPGAAAPTGPPAFTSGHIAAR